MTDLVVDLFAETPYIWRARRTGHRHRLICFPHAGAGAGAYGNWARLLPPGIELAAVQLPGRQNRIAEEPFTEVGPLVRALTQALRPLLNGSFAFFGHCGGAVLAFELAQALQARGTPRPSHLFLSGQPAPEAAARVWQLHELPDEQFRAEVVHLGGIDPEVAQDQDVMDALLPILRDDFRLWERHRMVPGPPLDAPITALAGRSDPRTPVDSVEGWRRHTNAQFNSRLSPGGHFFFLDEGADVPGYIARTLLTPQLAGRAS